MSVDRECRAREIGWVRRLAAPLLWLAVAVSPACRREPAPTPRRATSVQPPEPSPGARAVASVLSSVRTRELRLAAPGWRLQPLAFGRQLFVRLGEERIRAYSTPGLELLFERPLAGPRAVVEIVGGSVVVVGSERTLRIDPGAKEPARLGRVAWTPGVELLPERRDSAALWAMHYPGRILARHPLELSGQRSVEKIVTLEAYAGGPVTALRDGALLYRSSDGVRRALPGGRSQLFRSELEPWRLLPGRRVDQAWALSAEGRVELWQLGERLTVLERRSLDAAPFDAAASMQYLAVVVVEEGGGTPRRFRLVVLSDRGAPVLSRELLGDPPSDGERWAELAVRDRHVALADADPLVAVGGSGGAIVLELPGGTELTLK